MFADDFVGVIESREQLQRLICRCRCAVMALGKCFVEGNWK